MPSKKLVFISDTHGLHKQLKLPSGDFIIHAGDISSRGGKEEVKQFLDWFSNLEYPNKIFIAGNHDFFFEMATAKEIEDLIPENVVYLNDSYAKIDGISFWGSPVQPWFYNWAFNRKRGEEIKKHWDLIPNQIDVLITHGPPYKILDQTIRNEIVGCKDLLEKINKIDLKIHVFGHIHEAYGRANINGVKFINASMLGESYKLSNSAITVSLSI